MKKIRPLITIIILLLTLAASYALPKVKYTSPDIVSTLEIPFRTGNWRGKDMSHRLNLNDLRYNFISKVFTRGYSNYYGENLLLLILDAGNFHNPKVCFGSSGYKIQDLPDVELKLAGGKQIKAKAIFAGKDNEGFVLIYWITINKKVVDWTQQKILQLWYSLFNKEKVGLMVRLDIPATESTIKDALKNAQSFWEEASSQIPAEQKEYLFGK
jgi:EpsI family protein